MRLAKDNLASRKVMEKSFRRSLNNLAISLFSGESIAKSFYLLALIPVILMFFSYTRSPLGLVVPIYGFILLVLKKRKLFSHQRAGLFQKLLGLITVVASFFAYFLTSPFFPGVVFYGYANYFLYTIGLFLIFFQIQALKEAFSPLFLVAAFVTSSFVSDLAKSLFASVIPQLTGFVAAVLNALGIAATYSTNAPNTIVLNTAKGSLPLAIDWACIGFTTVYLFSIILIVIMYEDPSRIRTKVIWSTVGVLVTFLIAGIRLVAIFAGFYFLGSKYGQLIHLYGGYVLLITWSVIFFYLFSKRNAIIQKIKGIYEKVK